MLRSIRLPLYCILAIAMCGTANAKTQSEDEDSVYQWGRWAVLAPAAGRPDVAGPRQLVQPADLGPGEAEQLTGEVEVADNGGEEPPPEPPTPPTPPTPPQAAGPCNDGPCGFARIDTRSNAAGGDQTATYDLDLDEGANTTAFQVNPGEADEIASATTTVAVGTTNFITPFGSQPSAIRGALTRDGDTTPVVITGFWRHAGDQGEFVWGMPASAAELDGLQQGNVVADYNGAMADGGQASLSLDFGQQTWNGSFAGGAIDFSSNGEIDGAAIRSTGFSSNIDPEASFVEGGVVNHGDTVIGRFEVQDTGAEAAYSDIFRADRQQQVFVPTAE